LDTGRIPPCLALPALDTHSSETDDRDRPVPIAEFDSGPHLRYTPFSRYGGIDPLLTGQREVKGRSGSRHIVAIVRWVCRVALLSEVVDDKLGPSHIQRLPRLRRRSGIHLARILPACTSMIAKVSSRIRNAGLLSHLGLFAVAVQAVDLERWRLG